MKIIGKKSLLYWLRIPFSIYVYGFLSLSFWLFCLMLYYLLTKETNEFISLSQWENFRDLTDNNEVIQFHYPFTKMVLAAENSIEGIVIAFLGLGTICFILFISLQLVNQFSKESIFTSETIKNLNILGFGMLFIGVFYLFFDLMITPNKFDLTPPFFLSIIGIVILLVKEILARGKKIQEENDLTI